jgi:hypothetical protein
MPTTTERTSFTKDIQGRYLCNNLTEVDAWKSAGGRPFDFIIVGGGTFGSAIAEHLKISAPFLFRVRATPAEYSAGLKLAIERAWLVLHERGIALRG